MRKFSSLIALLVITLPTIGADNGPVSRAVITTALNAQAQPVSNLSTVDNTVGNVMFYTEIVGMTGQTVAHRWSYNGKVIATINIQVRSNNTRTWSTASINTNQVGPWIVQVIHAGNGAVLTERNFEVTSPRAQSVQKRVLEQYDNTCPEKLAELERGVEENPDSAYFQFLLEQQQSRCN